MTRVIIKRAVKFRGKQITKERLGWWVSIILSRVFGAKVSLENSDKDVKIFPLIWGGKLHLFGAQYQALQSRFEWPYTLSLRHTDDVDQLGEQSVQIQGEGRICVVLCHLAAGRTDRIMEFFERMTPDARIVLAYGGKKDQFESILFENKFFIQDSKIRGVGYRQSYFGMMDDLSVWMDERKISPRWITITDYDCLPLDAAWNNSLIEVMEREKGDFGGKNFRNCTGDNSLFVCNAVRDGVLQDLEKSFPEMQMYQCIGALLCCSGGGLTEMRSLRKELEGVFFEVALPTAARLKRLKLVSFDAVSGMTRGVRFLPEHNPVEIPQAIRDGIRILHPVKRIEEAYDTMDKFFERL